MGCLPYPHLPVGCLCAQQTARPEGQPGNVLSDSRPAVAPGSAHLGVSTPAASTNRATPSSRLIIAGEAGKLEEVIQELQALRALVKEQWEHIGAQRSSWAAWIVETVGTHRTTGPVDATPPSAFPPPLSTSHSASAGRLHCWLAAPCPLLRASMAGSGDSPHPDSSCGPD